MASSVAIFGGICLLGIGCCYGIWRYFPLRRRASLPRDMVHPVLGAMYLQNANSWYRENLEPFACPGRPTLTVKGDWRGPSNGCASTYSRLREKWPAVAEEVAKDLLQTNQALFVDNPGNAMHSTAEVWASTELVDVDIEGDGDFVLTFETKWRDETMWYGETRLVETMHFFMNWQPTMVSDRWQGRINRHPSGSPRVSPI